MGGEAGCQEEGAMGFLPDQWSIHRTGLQLLWPIEVPTHAVLQ